MNMDPWPKCCWRLTKCPCGRCKFAKKGVQSPCLIIKRTSGSPRTWTLMMFSHRVLHLHRVQRGPEDSRYLEIVVTKAGFLAGVGFLLAMNREQSGRSCHDFSCGSGFGATHPGCKSGFICEQSFAGPPTHAHTEYYTR